MSIAQHVIDIQAGEQHVLDTYAGEQNVLDTYAGKPLSYFATDV